MENKVVPKKVNGKSNRRKGHNYERKWAKSFRDMGYTYCKTSRQASRLLDDSKVDLAFIPFNIQCKSVQSSINYTEEIRVIEESLKKNFPPEDKQHCYPIIIAHKKGSKPEEELVVMRAIDFLALARDSKLVSDYIKENYKG